MGEYMVRVDRIASHRGSVAEYTRTKNMPSVQLTALSLEEGTTSRALLAAMYAEGFHHTKSGYPVVANAAKQVFRLFRPALTQRKCPHPDLVIKAFTRFADGTIPLHLVVLHPAQFLRDINGPVSDFGASIACSMGRTMTSNFIRQLFTEVEIVLFAVTALLAVQYSGVNGLCEPEKVPRWMAARNPFEDPDHMIYEVADAPGGGFIERRE
jgi:hypothetical protein